MVEPLCILLAQSCSAGRELQRQTAAWSHSLALHPYIHIPDWQTVYQHNTLHGHVLIYGSFSRSHASCVLVLYPPHHIIHGNNEIVLKRNWDQTKTSLTCFFKPWLFPSLMMIAAAVMMIMCHSGRCWQTSYSVISYTALLDYIQAKMTPWYKK